MTNARNCVGFHKSAINVKRIMYDSISCNMICPAVCPSELFFFSLESQDFLFALFFLAHRPNEKKVATRIRNVSIQNPF